MLRLTQSRLHLELGRQAVCDAVAHLLFGRFFHSLASEFFQATSERSLKKHSGNTEFPKKPPVDAAQHWRQCFTKTRAWTHAATINFTRILSTVFARIVGPGGPSEALACCEMRLAGVVGKIFGVRQWHGLSPTIMLCGYELRTQTTEAPLGPHC